MKYNSNNKPLVCMQTQSNCYKGTSTMTPKGVLWHSTGANNPTLKRYVQPSDVKPKEDTYSKEKWLEVLGTNKYKNDWNHADRDAGLNCWIGKLANGTITTIQTMPWNFKPWGCGKGSKGSCNNGWIQFEICEDDMTDKNYFNAVYKEACEITAYICQLYNIDPKGTTTFNGVNVPTILCHQDAYKLGLGSNHGDVYTWFKKHGKTMDNVRNDVAALMGATSKPSQSTTVGTYKVVTEINKYTSASDAKAQKNSKGKLAPGTYYIYTGHPNGYNGMYNLTTDKTGKEPGSWINPAENVAPVSTVKEYKVVTSINRYSTLTDAVNKTNSKGTYAAGTYYIYEKYPDGNKGMFNISTDKTGKSAGSWINPSENVIKESVPTPAPVQPEKPKVEEPKVEVTPKKVYECKFPTTHKICDGGQLNNDNYKKKFAQVCESILKNNSKFDTNIVKAFFSIAPIYGIDPVRAISQSILETGWFKYSGSAVTSDQHNYCGLGVTSNGVKGNSFATIEDGVRAQIQHLFAYGSKDTLPVGEKLLDERFKYVTRGIALTWEELAGRWCVPGYEGNDPEASIKAGTTYGQKIDKLYESIVGLKVSDETIEKYFPKEVSKEQIDNEEPKPQPAPIEPEKPVEEEKQDSQITPQEPNKSDNKVDEIETEEPKTEPSNKESGIDTEKVNTILDILTKILTFIVDLFKKK